MPTEGWLGRPLAETRGWLELARLVADPVFHGADVPHGDGRPVILMPGFLAGDQTLAVIAAWLRRIGYRPHFCGFVLNAGCSDRTLDRVERRVDALWRAHGRRMALIGHSRGGHFARALAARRPDLVSHAASGRARKDARLTRHCGCPFSHDFARPSPSQHVRLTSIYSKGDGVVHWQCQLIPDADSIEVTGSHIGLVFKNRTVQPFEPFHARDGRGSSLRVGRRLDSAKRPTALDSDPEHESASGDLDDYAHVFHPLDVMCSTMGTRPSPG